VTDYFHLAYGADMHNYLERFLVVLDPPLGDVHGLHMKEGESGSADEVQLLDAALDPAQPLSTVAVETYSEEAE
jgi:hypothetical protein